MIDTWKLMPDGRIKGVISPDGDNVLTSPLKNINGLRETATIQTVSGSQYLLGTPGVTPTDNKLSADQLGIPREILGGGGGEEVNNKNAATRPLMSTPTTSQDRVLQNYLANRERATVPLSSSDRTDPISKKKNSLLTRIGGASAILVGAAIGTGVVSEKGIFFDNVNNVNVDPREVWKSAKSLNLPDIKSLKAPVIPSVSLPQKSLFDTKDVKLPDINLPNILNINLPDVKLPDVSLLGVPSVPVIDRAKYLGNGVVDTIGNALRNAGVNLPSSSSDTKKITSVGQGPYRVPMPYLDHKIILAEKERKALAENEKKMTGEKEEAIRMQIMREEAEARQKVEDALKHKVT